MNKMLIIMAALCASMLLAGSGCKSKGSAPRIPVLGTPAGEEITFEETAIIPLKEGPEGARKPRGVIK